MYSGKVVLFGKKLLCSGKRGYSRANVVVFVQGGCIWAESGCFRAKWFYSGKVVVIGQKWLY